MKHHRPDVDAACDSSADVVVVTDPRDLGDTYAEVMETLRRFQRAGKALAFAPARTESIASGNERTEGDEPRRDRHLFGVGQRMKPDDPDIGVPYYDEREANRPRIVRLPRCTTKVTTLERLLNVARLSGTTEPIVRLLLDDASVTDDQRVTLFHHLACHPRGARLAVHLLHRADTALQHGARTSRAMVLQRLLLRLRALDIDVSDPSCSIEWADDE